MNARLEALLATSQSAWAAEQGSGRVRINVCLDTSSIAQGAEETIAALKGAIAAKNLNAEVGIIGTFGFCWLEPTVTVRNASGTQTVLYANITAGKVDDFLQRVVIEGVTAPELALGVVEGTSTADIALLTDHPFMQGQVRRVMANIGIIDPENIDHYIAKDGYAGFGKALDMSAEEIVKEMVDSGLGGRAGGGFPTGRKWDFLRNATTHPRYLVCNADEGDPGAWVNRVLMEGDPHIIIEGMLIAALAAEADEGYIYIRNEYPLCVRRMEIAVQQAYAKGLVGKDILGSGKDFELIVFRGAGSYVCGEETGLIASVDGYRGMPRIKPPFPAQAGLWNKPTNVNNVESYANAPMIMRNGPAWWSGVSTAKEKGTKMFTFSGSVNWASCVEVPFGPSIRECLDRYAGGMREGKKFKGFQPGGPLSGVVNGGLDLTLTLDPYREKSMFLGGGGIVFFDESNCIVDMCKYFLGFCEAESCGRCTTCHGGTQRATEVLRRLAAGGGREADVETMQQLARTLVWSNCFHGQFAMTTVKTALKEFEKEWQEHIVDKYCRAGVCHGLIEYRVASQSADGMADAQAICPTSAITGGPGSYAVDDSLCIRCNACKELSPAGMEVRHRFALEVSEAAAAAAG